MPHATSSQGTIKADIPYFKVPASGEYGVQRSNSAGYKRQEADTHRVEVKDIREIERDFNLDNNGFQVVDGFDFPYELWEDDAKVREQAYQEAKDLVKKVTGCTHVSVFSHVLRRDTWQKAFDMAKELPDEAEIKLSHPSKIAHIDQTYYGAKVTVNNVADRADLAPKTHSRWGIINVWRPLKTINRSPLAVCDAGTVAESDLKEVAFRTDYDSPARDKKGLHYLLSYVWMVLHNPEHKWYWPSNLTTDECLLIKCFDTKLDGRARRAPHCAIETPTDHGPPRESVEIRCLVFWEDQPHFGDEEQYVCDGKDTWVPVET